MKIGVMYGNPETTIGGNALQLYAPVRLDIRRTGQIKDRDEIVGNTTRVKVVKNKVAPPFKQEIGRASCRERVCQYVKISVVDVYFKNATTSNQHQERKPKE